MKTLRKDHHAHIFARPRTQEVAGQEVSQATQAGRGSDQGQGQNQSLTPRLVLQPLRTKHTSIRGPVLRQEGVSQDSKATLPRHARRSLSKTFQSKAPGLVAERMGLLLPSIWDHFQTWSTAAQMTGEDVFMSLNQMNKAMEITNKFLDRSLTVAAKRRLESLGLIKFTHHFQPGERLADSFEFGAGFWGILGGEGEDSPEKNLEPIRACSWVGGGVKGSWAFLDRWLALEAAV